jgi:hypothetical protein
MTYHVAGMLFALVVAVDATVTVTALGYHGRMGTIV